MAAGAFALAACATPSERYDRRAAELAFPSSALEGDGFRHRAFASVPGESARTLHVYVEHDGTPWIDHQYVSVDPTPRSPFALELMARDAGPRLLLGRPCQFDASSDPACGPLLWTHRRYSPEVVASMAAAVRRHLAASGHPQVVLVGYSGGGTLAWLMAPQLPGTVAVITVAANLDTDAWSALHGYTPLAGSLNPAAQPSLPAGIAEVHYAGARDRNVPPAIAESFRRRHPSARVVVVDGFDHECCWIERWPELLAGALGGAGTTARPAP